ncbi:hypothetical protein PV382_23435 [Streptomyces scabiei]|uniref:hypothetical protein n=1 Tax=Streptomyces scabiei TaxID=1930 RepID=UPI0029ABBDFB|nr:hypothetical protein [Streptomyces scabiei]MDX3175206.1 hypothetical protein [Streptomyces scabiei]
MAAQLAATVYLQDPDTRQTVELAEGTLPEPRLAALVTNPAAWVDGKLPRRPKATAQTSPKDKDEQGGDPTGDGPDDASGAGSDADSQPTLDQSTEPAAPAAKKTAAAKTAARKPARGRDAADQGDGGA